MSDINHGPDLSRAICPHPDNPRYFLFRGKPTILVTATEHYGAVMNAAFRYEEYLDMLQSFCFNLTRIFVLMREHAREFKGFLGLCNMLAPKNEDYIAPWQRSSVQGCLDGGNKFDLNQWNEAFFQRLGDFCMKAGEKGIAVEVVFFSQLYKNKEDSPWLLSVLNPQNNTDGIGAAGYNRYTSCENQELLTVQENLVRKVVDRLKNCDNIYYEICNEPPYPEANDPEDMPDDHPNVLGEEAISFWHNRIADVVMDAEASLANKHMIAAGFPQRSLDIGKFSIFNYHYKEWAELGLKHQFHHGKILAFDETLAGIQSWNREIDFFDGRRQEAWEFLMRGYAVYDYLDITVAPGDPRGEGKTDFPGGHRYNGTMLRLYLKHLKNFFDGLDFVHMQPDDTIVRGIFGTAKAWALSGCNGVCAVYINGSALKRISLSIPAGSWQIEWHDPVTGRVDKVPEPIHGGDVDLELPLYHTDIALKISRSD